MFSALLRILQERGPKGRQETAVLYHSSPVRVGQ